MKDENIENYSSESQSMMSASTKEAGLNNIMCSSFETNYAKLSCGINTMSIEQLKAVGVPLSH